MTSFDQQLTKNILKFKFRNKKSPRTQHSRAASAARKLHCYPQSAFFRLIPRFDFGLNVSAQSSPSFHLTVECETISQNPKTHGELFAAAQRARLSPAGRTLSFWAKAGFVRSALAQPRNE